VLVEAPSEQASTEHIVPVANRRHAPAPSHFPSVPQVVGSVATQSVAWATPALTGAHLPFGWSVLATRQDVHFCEQALSQHTPSTQ
jgi:hypothetical protein